MVIMRADPSDAGDDDPYWWSVPMPRFDTNDDLDDELTDATFLEELADWELELLAEDGHAGDAEGRLCSVCGPGQSCPALDVDESPLQEAQ